MEKRDNLKHLLNINQGATKRLIEDVTPEEALYTIDGYANHILWLAGHIASSANTKLRLLGKESMLPDGWAELFKRGAEFHADSSVYPSFDEVKTKVDEIYDAVMKAADEIDSAKFEDEVEVVPEWKENRMNALLFFSLHEFYHAGQIAVLRRTLGKDRTFG